MDITIFMEWFLTQTVNIFSWAFSLLNNITFMGTSLLKVSITIIILGSLIGVVLTISKSVNYVGSKSEKIKDNHRKETNNE